MVEWLDGPDQEVPGDLKPKIGAELKRAFGEAKAITVCHCLAGYSENAAQKVVLTIQVRSVDGCRVHVVKLGDRDLVERDFVNWRKCLRDHGVASHIFLRVEPREWGVRNRLAVVYEDAYQYFGEDQRQPKAHTLEEVTLTAIRGGSPDVRSVERVIRQVLCESQRCLYRDGRPNQEAARKFYRHKLRINARHQRGVHQWRQEADRRDLRRDLIWLFYPLDHAVEAGEPVYLDAYDYVTWALGKRGYFPQTLIGRSHGDLHGRNVVVGIERDEAEFPLVFDYEDMCDKNALVWDFVKLETELKVRLLCLLFDDEGARKELLPNSALGLAYGRLGQERPSSAMNQSRVARVDRLVFAYAFESLLAGQSLQIDRMGSALSPEPPGGRKVTRSEKVNRALGILLRIRQEAAAGLGALHRRPGAQESWYNEYAFALAVYGLSTAKYEYTDLESVFALVSAGVACAHVSAAGEQIQRQINQARVPSGPYFCYQVPLAHAHRLWASGLKGKRAQAEALLRKEVKTFSHAVPLLVEYGLLLIEVGKSLEALRLLEPLEEDARLFGDYELLARIGRGWKDHGDAALETNTITAAEFLRTGGAHPSWQFYHNAVRLYEAAYGISRHYYPGVNVATLAYMLGERQRSRQVAKEVLRFWAKRVGPEAERFWILASEGDASLLTGGSKPAAEFYRAAMEEVDLGQAGIVQSTYNQLCRLYWALGRDRVIGSLEVFRSFHGLWRRLRPGPFGDCGDAHRRTGGRGKRSGRGARRRK